MKRLAVLAAVVLAVAACGTTTTTTTNPKLGPPTVASTPSPAPTSSPPALHQVHDPGQVTGTLTGPCHATGQLPDPACTPGAYDPAVTAAILCAHGYTTRTYRAPESQTQAFKFHAAYPAYGIADVPGTVSELDHLVSLELAGANDASNLWPELGSIPNPKDSVENALHAWVCAATGTAAQTRLHDAQVAIAADWQTALAVLHVNTGAGLAGNGG